MFPVFLLLSFFILSFQSTVDIYKFDQINTTQILKYTQKISIIRVPDTKNHKIVQNYILKTFKEIAPNWEIEVDKFTADTPFGAKKFTNLIFTKNYFKNIDSEAYIVLAAHYDSKYFSDFEFEGAIDSAVPCSILIDFAARFEVFSDPHVLIKPSGKTWGIKIIFFDGEEAFVNWNDKDSIYGSRNLATKWSMISESESESGLNSVSKSLIEKIDCFFLFDLLGSPNMSPIGSRFERTDSKFDYFYEAQEELKRKSM